MGFWFEIVVISLLLAISINLQRIYLLMKNRDEKMSLKNQKRSKDLQSSYKVILNICF